MLPKIGVFVPMDIERLGQQDQMNVKILMNVFTIQTYVEKEENAEIHKVQIEKSQFAFLVECSKFC